MGRPVTDEEHRQAVQVLVRELGKGGLSILAVGSTAVLFATGRLGMTKDADVHPFPVEDWLAYHDLLEAVLERLGGTLQLETDGASMTAHIPVRGRNVPVELIEGREDFIQPEVLADAVASSRVIDGVHVPTWEHIVTMKAEAWFDRTGSKKDKFLEDLGELRDRIQDRGASLSRSEVRRLVGMRPERKHDAMNRVVDQTFSGMYR